MIGGQNVGGNKQSYLTIGLAVDHDDYNGVLLLVGNQLNYQAGYDVIYYMEGTQVTIFENAQLGGWDAEVYTVLSVRTVYNAFCDPIEDFHIDVYVQLDDSVTNGTAIYPYYFWAIPRAPVF
jgi:hypothetical protein